MAVSDVVISFIVLVAIYGILSYGLTLKYGHTGLLDFGHVGFFLVGAYTSALFVLPPDEPGDFTAYVVGLGDVPVVGTWVVGIVVATVLSGIIGGLVALPTIRLREDYLAITVLGVSVIFQRFIQAESWFANGPDALRGYSPPLKSSFPLLLEGQVGVPFLGVSLPATPTLFGVITAVVWGIALAVLAGERGRGSPLPVSALYLVGSFGLSTLSRPGGPLGRVQVAAAGGVVAAGLMAVLLAVADRILLVGVLVSAFTWLVLVAVLARLSGRFTRREWLSGIALGTGFLVALLPIPYAGAVSVKVAGSLLLLGIVIGGFYRAVQSLDWFATAKVQIIGVATLWFVGIWYFVIPLVGPFSGGQPGAALKALVQNLVWILAFGGDVGVDYIVAFAGTLTVQVDYQRFLLAGFVLCLLGAYYLLELTARSPFGRVLRAVRNDEDVVRSLGKDPFVYKIQSMVIGSALAGFAGALWAMYTQGLTFVTFAPRVTFIALLIVFIGGPNNNKGTILGAAVFWAFQQATTQIASFFPPALRVNVVAFRLVVMGILFLIVLYYLPDGLLGKANYSTPGGVNETSNPQREGGVAARADGGEDE
ncbi:branched-chain amino acid ABC transporter permease [Haloarcula sp. S1AR25-5A]|uniref:Branched-chain amino acid ABC transporter permease n=1 Tax=Haloarcula terrestris TaxID=2950533 RepID=A0AAE4F0R2_9EURY|nr:branched-chain amino acid ABC transporter permease [Haloarcula terrestris]MDS0222388.1 branched-chain amino acid ABC transporter permease [Haloarcula terrestris]